MRYIIVDLESTCWQNVRAPVEIKETIEIGAVALERPAGPVSSEFVRLVRPVARPQLSAFCTELTSITQAEVDRADYFWQVWPEFLAWIGHEPWTFCCWGNYDVHQLRADCRRHGLAELMILRFINLKTAFANYHQLHRCGMPGALEFLGLRLEGRHHRGIDDAHNIAKIAMHLLPRIEPRGATEPPPWQPQGFMA